MRRSFRTHRFVAGRTQGSTLGWYAAPRWGFQHTERTGSFRGIPRVLPWAGMSRPVGAFNTQNAPVRCGLEGVNEVPICRCGEPLARGYNRNG